MKTVRVSLGDRAYDVNVGAGVSVGSSLSEGAGLRVLLVSDSNVDPLYGDRCEEQLSALGCSVARSVVPAGEESKSLARVEALYTEALAAGLERTSVIVALGGGMVGDLAGFVAATYLRGIGLVQVPTTVLAMVDSAVGGKTAVNLPEGKNLVGSFHQPAEVAADLATLKTLPEREYASGLAEVVKYGVIWDAALFADLEKDAEGLLTRDMSVLEDVVTRCCEIKAEVVQADEKESSLRAILNFGHTLGHALERVLGYGRCLHGEAVSAGMAYALRLSSAEKGLPGDEAERAIALLARLGLPVDMAGLDVDVTWADLRAAMVTDKKAIGSVPRFVLAEKLGSVVFGCEPDEETLAEVFLTLCGT
ncbi:3-dehydroquinate synthase [Verrucomicrobiota bacterium]